MRMGPVVLCSFVLAAAPAYYTTSSTLHAATFTVDSLGSAGPGTLAQAILDANATAGLDTIKFNISGAGPHVIVPTSRFQVTDSVVIDGYTQPGSSPNTNPPSAGTNADLRIVIDGSSVAGTELFDITAGNCILRGLVINNVTTGAAIRLSGAGGNRIAGNFFGTDPTGTTGVFNLGAILIDDSADNIIGGDLPEHRNLIANSKDFIVISGSLSTGNLVAGNLIGTNRFGAGTGTLGAKFAIAIVGSSSNTIGGVSAARRNIIAASSTAAIYIGPFATNNAILGNFVGLDVTGTSGLGGADGIDVHGDDNVIGGTDPGAGNVVGWNSLRGIYVGGNGNTVQGNYVGIDRSGTIRLDNHTDGISVGGANNQIGGTTAGAPNLVCYNRENGISVKGYQAIGNTIEGNFVGTDAGGVPRGNKRGILIDDAADNMIGGVAPGAGNVIAYNDSGGIEVALGTGNSFLTNSVHDNGLLGIDLNSDGVTNNDGVGDPDGGPNTLQNFPRLSVAASSGGGLLVVSGRLNSAARRDFRVEVFASDSCDSSGWGEGQTFLHAVYVTTDWTGRASFSAVLPAFVGVGDVITATATDTVLGNTSEFSHCREVIEGLALLPGSYYEVPLNRMSESAALWNIKIPLENLGPGSAHNVTATMVDDGTTPWLTIPDSIVFYGDMPESTSAEGQGTYALDLADWEGNSFYVRLKCSYEDSNSTQHTTTFTQLLSGGATGIDEKPIPPNRSALFQNVPNPFNPSTTIQFDVATGCRVELRVYDVAGRLVRTLVDEELPRARHAVEWDGRNDRGAHVASGVYFYRLTTSDYDATRKMVLLK